ncbi:O-antigen ligase family protein [Leptospira alstonii]|uniref:O-antigen ligase n=2 Tax=Leptospira alstonii TaxID=28452 RepID=M6DBV5_9LEPT|nr:O-antigen ligase family protein [Leptospira alstonii]EMJ96010.1 O-antigen ligase [Leptospira alstonii serovar Sichuan str. 79601]EQA79965.1 O-antigen ligase [Leptospira alstonii serovar Pingchang str. 80-412]
MKDRITNGLQTASLVSICLFLLSFPQSVSVSQIFGSLTIATTYPLFFLDAQSRKNWKRILNPFLLFFGIYLLLFLSSLLHAETTYSAYTKTYSAFFKKFLKQSESGDFWMLLLFPASFLVASQEKNQTILKRFLIASASITIVLGCISLFSEVRIGKFVANGFRYAPGDRLQHFSGNLGPIKLYLPIGMMNTHLTFGGLLGLCLPGLLVDWFITVKKKKNFVFVLKTVLVIAGFLILFFNQSRSIWLGVFTILLILLFKGTFGIRKSLSKVSLRSKILAGLVVFFVVLSASYLFRNNWLIQRSVSQIFEVHNTENQRYYIYKNTIPLVQEHFLTGVGGGNYKDFHWKESAKMIEKEEQLWYELYITPRGHAHNDLLHFFTTGGIFAGILFLLFWGKLFRSLFQKDFSSGEGIPVFAIGVLSLFPAGFFQCYLLDDEVVLPFFAFCGIFLGGRWNSLQTSEKKDIFDRFDRATGIPFSENWSSVRKNSLQAKNNSDVTTNSFFLKIISNLKRDWILTLQIISAIGIPILLYWLFWIPRLNLEPLEVYNRRVRASDLALVKEVQKNILKFEIVSDEVHSPVNPSMTPSEKNPTSSPQSPSQSNVQQNSEPSAMFHPSALSVEQASLPFQVEGCLTHRYRHPPLPRKTPFSFTIYIPENSSASAKRAEITIVSRDSFDQDQLYWAHGETDLSTISVELHKGKNPILIPDSLVDTTPAAFPDGVFFRDYRIRYSGFETEGKIEFPKLYFGKICDTVIRLTR